LESPQKSSGAGSRQAGKGAARQFIQIWGQLN